MDQQAKEKLATQPNIYVDCKMLLGRLYDIRWKAPRRDRSYLFNDLLIPISLSLITHFRKAYKFREERLKEIDLFLFEFYRFEELIYLASSKKIINEKQTASILEYLVRIRSNMTNGGKVLGRLGRTPLQTMATFPKTRKVQEEATDSYNPVLAVCLVDSLARWLWLVGFPRVITTITHGY